MKNKKQFNVEPILSFFAWFSGLITSLVVAYGVWEGAIRVPEILPGHLFSDILAWTIAGTALGTIILSFFRK